MTQNLYDLLADRGMVAQTTDENIRQRLQQPVTVYNGFDPTADSLHVGHLVPMMGLAWAQRCGHRPIALVGGATALVGDPSGKTETRKMLSAEQVADNAQAIKAQLSRVIRFDDDDRGGLLLNNADWLNSKGWIQMLREVGPHFSVNRMLTMDSVKGRMTGDGDGISFLEFNYMVMQAYDFLHLRRERGCTLQTGGQDQWGNIVMGIELIRRVDAACDAKATGPSAHPMGLTFPLVTKADGGKFGKTESGAVWLSADRTSPYDFYQFFRNTPDADVAKYLGFFTFLPMEQVRELTSREGRELNDAKEVLAYEVTRLIHGDEEANRARSSARNAFGAAQDVTGDAIPHAPLDAAQLAEGMALPALMTRAGLTASNGEARRLIQGGGVRIHGDVIKDPSRAVREDDVRDGYILIRVGKKRLFRFDVGA